MDGEGGAVTNLLKKLRGKAKGRETSGARQMTMLRRLPKLLRFIPGTAQDMRSYFLGMGYLLAGSAENMEGLIRHLIGRYAPPTPRFRPPPIPSSIPMSASTIRALRDGSPRTPLRCRRCPRRRAVSGCC